MNNFIQTVFNKISLERDPRLWQSEDDSLMPKRLKLLSEFEDTLFSAQLFNDKNVSKSLRKNVTLCNAFKKKLEGLASQDDQEKKLALLNQAICFSDIPEKESENYECCKNTYLQLLLERIQTLSRLNYKTEALEDLKVLEDYIEITNSSCDQRVFDCFARYCDVKFEFFRSSLSTNEKQLIGNKADELKLLVKSKDITSIKEFLKSMEHDYIQGHVSLVSNIQGSSSNTFFYYVTLFCVIILRNYI